MSRGNKSKYTIKEKTQARHIEQSYEHRGVNKKTADKRAWATVNKIYGGGENPGGSGRGKGINTAPYRKGGKLGGKASARRPFAKLSASATKPARARRQKNK
jgi:hypothetical protein